MRIRRAALAIAIVGLAAATVPSAAVEIKAPTYDQLLKLPELTDRFGYPRSVAVDSATDEIFVCDTRKRRVVIYDRLGVFRYQIQGGTLFHSPKDVAVDPDGYIFLLAMRGADHKILHLDFDGVLIEEIPVPHVDDETLPPDPVSLAVSPSGKRLYVLDYGTQKLWLISRDGTVEGSVELAEGLSEDERRAQLQGHVDVYDDTVLVSMPTTGMVQLFDLDGEPSGHVGLRGTAACQTAFPVAAALDRMGRVLVLDKQRMLFTLWDRAENKCLAEYSGIGRSRGALYNPEDLALDSRGRIYISQGFEGRVQVYKGVTPAAAPPALPASPVVTTPPTVPEESTD